MWTRLLRLDADVVIGLPGQQNSAVQPRFCAMSTESIVPYTAVCKQNIPPEDDCGSLCACPDDGFLFSSFGKPQNLGAKTSTAICQQMRSIKPLHFPTDRPGRSERLNGMRAMAIQVAASSEKQKANSDPAWS